NHGKCVHLVVRDVHADVDYDLYYLVRRVLDADRAVDAVDAVRDRVLDADRAVDAVRDRVLDADRAVDAMGCAMS
ncbi:unnamed protein product, partial [Rotaria socialis]